MIHKRMAALILMGILAASAFGQNGIIIELTGTVELRQPGAADFVAAQIGDTLSADTLISTGFRSSALIEVGSSLLTVRPLTLLTLTEIRSAGGMETININLQAGRVRVDVAPPAGTRATMGVQGPHAAASVRGTSFEFDTRILTVHKGVVAFNGSRGGVQLVSAGFVSQLSESGRAADSIQIAMNTLSPAPPSGSDSGINHHPPIVDVLQVTFDIYP